MTLYTVECTCKPDEPYADGSLPEFYTDHEQARMALLRHVIAGKIYFGVHWNGGHCTQNMPKHLLKKYFPPRP